MPVPKKRFEFVDGENKLMVTDFYKVTSNELVNFPYVDIDFSLGGLEDLLNSGNVSVTPRVIDEIEELVEKLFDIDFKNIPLNFFTSLMSSNNYESVLNKLLKGLFGTSNPDLILLNLLKKFVPSFPTGTTTPVKTQDIVNFVKTINSITGDGYGNGRVDPDAVLLMLRKVLNQGYDNKMYGIFTILSQDLTDTTILAYVAKEIISQGAEKGDIMMIMDIAASSIGPMVRTTHPTLVRDIMKGFKLPSVLHPIDQAGFALMFVTALNKLDNTWMLQAASGSVSSDFSRLLTYLSEGSEWSSDAIYSAVAGQLF